MESYDVIIIGTGAGGGTLAHRLAPSGKRILILERGGFLPREKQNWESAEVFLKARYHTNEMWLDKKGHKFMPGTGYYVGGNTKVFGGAMFRLRKRDFETVQHKDGISPEWPVKYRDFSPYYTQAEKIYGVHGQRGIDPTEPEMETDYPFPALRHEPRIQELHDRLVARGLAPFSLPLSVRFDPTNRLRGQCIRCNTCDGHPCLLDAKSDADIAGVRPALQYPNVTLFLRAKVKRLRTENNPREISAVEVELDGALRQFKADLVVVAAGAVNSAVILLRSANEKHPRGLANSSDQVGRNYMRHLNCAMLGVTPKKNPSVFQKTMGMNDFYWGEKDFPFPMGHIQLLGKADKNVLASDSPFYVPHPILKQLAARSIDWWMSSEDLPHPDNRVTLDRDDQIHLNLTDRYHEHFDRLMKRWIGILKKADAKNQVVPLSFYLRKNIPIKGTAHQNGTCRFGEDPATSVLNVDCRAHDVENLYVVDGSFFPSCGAVNPSLTIAANALRVGDHILERLG